MTNDAASNNETHTRMNEQVEEEWLRSHLD
jgi:hypothetical protein